jgi:hypothetical protein
VESREHPFISCQRQVKIDPHRQVHFDPPFGKAAAYALTRWEELTRYAREGRLEIDNNLVENQVRPVALGRKNYLFAGSHDAARRSAVIYSMLATCKRHGVNPWAWLTNVLSRIPTHPAKRVAELLLHRWM